MNGTGQDEDFLRTITVLYVEDDEETRCQLSAYLRSRVGVLVTADDGAAGLEAFRAHRVQMVISDILMPGMDGLTMVQRIRELDPAVPVIVTTAFEETNFLLRSIEIGVDKYVTKPVSMERLNAAMAHIARQLRGEGILKRLSSLHHQSEKLEALGIVAVGMSRDFDIMAMSIERALACAEPKSDLRKNLELAANSCDRAACLGRTLLNLANDNCSGGSRTCLVPIIRESVTTVLAGTDIALECNLPETLPAVSFNADQMRMVFGELAKNARTAMSSEGTLQVTGDRCAVNEDRGLPLPNGDYLHICISDDGVGITAQDLPRIFDPYWSTEPTGTQKGMGLGLTLCYSIVKKHGGVVVAESEPGCGASFSVYLPVAE